MFVFGDLPVSRALRLPPGPSSDSRSHSHSSVAIGPRHSSAYIASSSRILSVSVVVLHSRAQLYGDSITKRREDKLID